MESNKVAVITGGGRGLGEATVIDLLLQGFKVVCADHNEMYIDQVAKKIDKEHFSSFLPCKTDVSNRNDVKNMYSKALDRFGTIDILINFAGINRDKPFLELDDEDWDNVMNVHLKGAFICCQEFVKCKSKGTAKIINVSAACGIQGRKNGANFCSAKGGILAFTKCLALELSPRIQVNCLIPSAVDTPEVRERYKLDTKEGLDSVVSGIPTFFRVL